MSGNTDCPAFRTRKKQSEGDNTDEGIPTPRVKRKSKKETFSIKKNSKSVSTQQPIDNYLLGSGSISETEKSSETRPYSNQLRRRSLSGSLYTTEKTINLTPKKLVMPDRPNNNKDQSVTSMLTSNEGGQTEQADGTKTVNAPDARAAINTSSRDHDERRQNLASSTLTAATVTSTTATTTTSVAHALNTHVSPSVQTPGRPYIGSPNSAADQLSMMGTQMMHQYQQAAGQQLFNGSSQLSMPLVRFPPNYAQVISDGRIAALQQEMNANTALINDYKNQMESFTFEQDEFHKMMCEYNKSMKLMQDKVNVMSNLMVRQEAEIVQLKERQHQKDTKHMKSEIRISGLIDDGSSPTTQATNFLKNNLKIQRDIPIEKAYRKGKGAVPALIVQFKDRGDKEVVYKNVKQLKGQKNANDRPYGVSSNLPERELEQDIRKRMIVQKNKNLPKHLQHKVSLTKGLLKVDGEEYKNAVQNLTAGDLLSLSGEDMLNSAVLDVGVGPVLTKEESVFHGFATTVDSVADVNRKYLHFKLKYADSTHVMMAYRLPGSNVAYDEGYQDDGEWGGGRRLLKILNEEDQLSVALFVIRKYGGKRLGTDRFEMISETAKAAMKRLCDGATEISSLKLNQRSTPPSTVRRPRKTFPSLPSSPGTNIRHSRPAAAKRAPPGASASYSASQPLPAYQRYNHLIGWEAEPSSQDDWLSTREEEDISTAEEQHSERELPR